MGKITESYEPDADLTVFTAEGELTFNEVLEQTRSFLSGKPSKLALWNLERGTFSKISSQEMEQIMQLGAVFSSGTKIGKAAILAQKDVDYGLGNVIRALGEIKGFPYKIKIFREMSAARDWLFSIE